MPIESLDVLGMIVCLSALNDLLPSRYLWWLLGVASLERLRFAAIKNYERLYVARDDYFSDAGHLNAQGSAAFSKVPAGDLDGVLKRMPRS